MQAENKENRLDLRIMCKKQQNYPTCTNLGNEHETWTRKGTGNNGDSRDGN